MILEGPAKRQFEIANKENCPWDVVQRQANAVLFAR